jgi:hypothetical protein
VLLAAWAVDKAIRRFWRWWRERCESWSKRPRATFRILNWRDVTRTYSPPLAPWGLAPEPSLAAGLMTVRTSQRQVGECLVPTRTLREKHGLYICDGFRHLPLTQVDELLEQVCAI